MYRAVDGDIHEEEHDGSVSFLAEYKQIVTDPAHVAAEVSSEIVSYLLFGIVVAKWVRRHDRKVHGTSPHKHGAS